MASGSIASVNSDSRWIGLNGPHSRIVWIKNELTTTASISDAHNQPNIFLYDIQPVQTDAVAALVRQEQLPVIQQTISNSKPHTS